MIFVWTSVVGTYRPLELGSGRHNVLSATVCTFGLESGLPRSLYNIASVAVTHPALRLTRQTVEDIVSPFEVVRLGTEVFFQNMVGNRPHWLDKDVRRLRLRFLPNHTFSKVALFNTVPD